MTHGLFITFEGGEGAGKSTQARLLAAQLKAHGIDAVVTREPGGAPCAEAIRNLLLSPGTIPANALTDTASGHGVVYATHIYPWKAGPCTQAGGCFDGAVPAVLAD